MVSYKNLRLLVFALYLFFLCSNAARIPSPPSQSVSPSLRSADSLPSSVIKLSESESSNSASKTPSKDKEDQQKHANLPEPEPEPEPEPKSSGSDKSSDSAPETSPKDKESEPKSSHSSPKTSPEDKESESKKSDSDKSPEDKESESKKSDSDKSSDSDKLSGSNKSSDSEKSSDSDKDKSSDSGKSSVSSDSDKSSSDSTKSSHSTKSSDSATQTPPKDKDDQQQTAKQPEQDTKSSNSDKASNSDKSSNSEKGSDSAKSSDAEKPSDSDPKASPEDEDGQNQLSLDATVNFDLSHEDPELKKVCDSTDHPLLCAGTAMPLLSGKITVNSVLDATVTAGTKFAKHAKSVAKKIMDDPNTSPGLKSIVKDCKKSYSTAVENFEKAMTAASKNDMGTMRSMLSGILTYLGECQEEIEKVQKDSVLKDYAKKLNDMTSNCLAMVPLMH